jgi:hypothetical protein
VRAGFTAIETRHSSLPVAHHLRRQEQAGLGRYSNPNRALKDCDANHPRGLYSTGPGPTLKVASTRSSCYTDFVETKRKLRNVTVTLKEDVARWARLEAARREMSVSRLLGAILEERMREEDGYEKAMRRALGRKPFLKTSGRYLSREEAHDRARLR